MARTTLTNEAVVQALANLEHLAVDLDDQPKVAVQYEIRAVPTFLMLTPTGESAASTTGLMNAEDFLGWISNSVQSVSMVVAQQRETKLKLASIESWLTEGGSNSLQNAVVELFSLCDTPNEATRAAAVEHLAAIGKQSPTLLLEGLNHPKLAVRIQIANLLRQQWGNDFEIDPWSPAATRQQKIVLWREKMTAPKTAL